MGKSSKLPWNIRVITIAPGLMILMVGCAILLQGCAGARSRDKTMRMLFAAGFKKEYAKTPESLARLKALPQRKLIRRERDGKVDYMYADVKECRCVYVGDEGNYERYQRLRAERGPARRGKDEGWRGSDDEMERGASDGWGEQ
jgi:hypothetical protein